MDVRVNDEPFAPSAAVTIDDLVTAIQGDDGDRLIVAIRLDGREVPRDELAEVLAMSTASPGRLEIEVESAKGLAAQTLGEAAKALEGTRQRYARIAELLACDKTDDAMALMNECFAVWNTAEQSLRQSAQAARIDLTAAGGLAEPPAAMVDRFTKLLKQIQQYLAARDFVAVADLIEYDLADITDDWRCTLVGLQQQLLAS